jgi:hypothetical protein
MLRCTLHRWYCRTNGAGRTIPKSLLKSAGPSNRAPRPWRLYSTNFTSTGPQYPGLGLPLRYDNTHSLGKNDVWYPIGSHPDTLGATSDMLLVREVAMMIIMDRLTDKPDWHSKVFNDDIVAKWKAEALALPVEPMYDEIENGRTGHPSIDPPKLKTILDEACVDYVLFLYMLIVRAAC